MKLDRLSRLQLPSDILIQLSHHRSSNCPNLQHFRLSTALVPRYRPHPTIYSFLLSSPRTRSYCKLDQFASHRRSGLLNNFSPQIRSSHTGLDGPSPFVMADTQGGTTESDQPAPSMASDQTIIKETPQEEIKAEATSEENTSEPSAPAEPAEKDGATQAETKVETAEATNGSVKTEETTAASTSIKETAQATTTNKRGGPHNRGAPHKTFRDRYRENIKFDPSTQQPTDDPEQIRKQVEFYFSDSNLPMDKFLIGKVGGAKNNPVEISTIHSFGRMRRFQPFSAVVAALKDSEILDVTEDKYVQRKIPIDEAALGKSVEEGQKWVEDKALHRSIYAVGTPG